MHGEMRDVDFFPLSFQRVTLLLLWWWKRSKREILHGEIALFVERLPVLQADGRTFWARDLQLHDSSEILPHIDHGFPGRCRKNGSRHEPLFAPHWWADRGNQVLQGIVDKADVLPGACVKSGLIPAGHFQPGIVDLPLLQIRFEDRSRRGTPH